MSKVTQTFKADGILKELAEIGDEFGIGEELVGQAEEAMDDFVYRGQQWAEACQEDWSQLKTAVPWETGNLSESIVWEDGFQEVGRPYFWVGVDLNALLGPKKRPVTNYIDYPDLLGEYIDVSKEDYTEAVNEKNSTGPYKFIENVWWVYADKNLKEAMR